MDKWKYSAQITGQWPGRMRSRPAAGKEEEYKGAAAAVPVVCNGGKRRDRIVIGLGVLSTGAGAGSALPDTGTVAQSAGR